MVLTALRSLQARGICRRSSLSAPPLPEAGSGGAKGARDCTGATRGGPGGASAARLRLLPKRRSLPGGRLRWGRSLSALPLPEAGCEGTKDARYGARRADARVAVSCKLWA